MQAQFYWGEEIYSLSDVFSSMLSGEETVVSGGAFSPRPTDREDSQQNLFTVPWCDMAL